MNAIKEEIGGALLRLLLKKTEGGEVLTVGEDKVIITHEQCPAVLLSANKNLPEILLVQKFTGLQIKQSHISTGSFSCSTPLGLKKSRTISSSSSDKPNDDMDVTGSPLKCPFMQAAGESNDASPFTIPLELCNGKNGNATLPYLPIPSTRAGLIASKLNLALCKLEADLGEFVPLWVACDGRDAQVFMLQGMLFIGMHRGQNTHHRTLVTSGGPYEGKETLPSLDHIMRHHTAIGPKKVDSAVKATYSIMASENEVRGSSLSLTCTWKRPFTVLSSPSPDASTMANVRVVRGDPRSPTFKMHSELDVLKHFVNGLETGEVLWLVREDSRTIAEELEEVFTSIREKGARVKREDEGGCEFDMMIQGKFFNWRLNMDITDQLWNVLMRCESYQELKDSLSLVFKAVAGEDIKPQFHACNTTQVCSDNRVTDKCTSYFIIEAVIQEYVK
ncbi:Protein zwilch [Chionoecetes opilio]|uniref:Protein zwilch n=1 Tax=Chionoecetes opilio TaxID=41210 RepID=A0A8J5CJC5_CHIOP|nr:Protein zwilch [Chionoecetes opilio]